MCRKFEEKKRQQSDKKTIKSFFKRASTFREYRPSFSSSQNISNDNSTNNNDRNSWQFFEKPLLFGEGVIAKLSQDIIARDIYANANKYSEKVTKLLNRGATMDELTECIYDYYCVMGNRFQSSPQYKDATSEQIDQWTDQAEKFLMNELYLNLFARVQSEEEERDLKLQKKIRNLNWIMCSHLDIDINLRHPKVTITLLLL